MEKNNRISALILGLSIFFGLSALGYFANNTVIMFKEYERTVTVKGLSEREYKANIVIWPIQFTEVSNNLEDLSLRSPGRAAAALRGRQKVDGQWKLYALVHNNEKLAHYAK